MVATLAIQGLTFRFEGAMLHCNREPHSDVQLTSGVSFDYTANLRCTHSSSASISPSGVAAGRFACARCTVRHKLVRTPVGSLAQRLSYRPWSPSCFLRSHPRAPRGAQPPRLANRVVRLAAWQRALARPARCRDEGGA